MKVIKRNGTSQAVALDKITTRIEVLAQRAPALNRVDPILVSRKVVNGLYDGVTTVELDNLTIETASSMTTVDVQYNTLAARIAVSNLHKQTPNKFSDCIEQLHNYKHPITGALGVLSQDIYDVVMAHKAQLDAVVDPEYDYGYTLFGFKTLERAYLLKCGDQIVERPGQMLLRVALGIHGDDIDSAIKTYTSMAKKMYTHATPTLFNSGTKRPQLASCFLLGMEDSIEGIYKTLVDTALISKNSGGIGLHCHDIRASGSFIAGTGGYSNGIIPMLRTFNASSRFIDQDESSYPYSTCFIFPYISN